MDQNFSHIGIRDGWGGEYPVGLSLSDRSQHLYLIGKTGSGKTTLLRNLIVQHLAAGHGVGLIDPHGDLAEELLDCIPPCRADDLVYFNPGDLDFPIGLNLIASVAPDDRHLVASGIVGAFKSIWRESWGPRLEYILYNAVAALLDCPRIVSEALWEQVQAVLQGDFKSTATIRSPSHSFTGLLFCACGGRMNASSSSPKYVCAKCGRRIPMADLEAVFLEEVASFLNARKQTVAEKIGGNPEVARARSLLKECEERTRKIDTETAKAERLYMENRISVERFEKLHHPLEAERGQVLREIGSIKARIKRLEEKGRDREKPAPFSPQALRDRWPTLAHAIRHEIARTFVERIVVSDDEIEFAYCFRDPSERTAKAQQFPTPTNSSGAGDSVSGEPLYIRLPKPGQLCPRTGMTRSALNELILPTERNSFQPPVESKCLRKREGGKGTRLIVWQSLKEYLARR